MGIKEQDIRQVYKTIDMGNDEFGEVQISDEVVSSIAALAINEVDGVHSTVGSITNEIAGKLGVKNLSKGVKAVIEDDNVMIDMNINMEYGFNILKTCSALQEKVIQTVNNMTGLNVVEVNVRIAGVIIEKDK